MFESKSNQAKSLKHIKVFTLFLQIILKIHVLPIFPQTKGKGSKQQENNDDEHADHDWYIGLNKTIFIIITFQEENQRNNQSIIRIVDGLQVDF